MGLHIETLLIFIDAVELWFIRTVDKIYLCDEAILSVSKKKVHLRGHFDFKSYTLTADLNIVLHNKLCGIESKNLPQDFLSQMVSYLYIYMDIFKLKFHFS